MSDTEERPKRIHGRKFLRALHDAGILSYDDYVRRVVIDASVESAVVIHVERYGDDRLFPVTQTLAGVEIADVDEKLKAQVQELLAEISDLRSRLEAREQRSDEPS